MMDKETEAKFRGRSKRILSLVFYQGWLLLFDNRYGRLPLDRLGQPVLEDEGNAGYIPFSDGLEVQLVRAVCGRKGLLVCGKRRKEESG